MTNINPLRERIERTTDRLAQLKAREILQAQRQAARERQTKQRQMTRRKIALGNLIFAARCEDLQDEEVVGVLVSYLETVKDAHARQRMRQIGTAHLQLNALEARTGSIH